MKLPLSFGEYGDLPATQNEINYPSILVDSKTNSIWIAALYSHGIGKNHTGQLPRAWMTAKHGRNINLHANFYPNLSIWQV
ncbi:MAG: hypothetical protein ACRCR9_02645 [Chitinophagaceae bacterium]